MLRADLVCVGGGLAGLTAGARAAELGLRVVVLEQGEDEHYPCNSRYSFGVIHGSYSDLKLGPDHLVAAMRAMMKAHASEELVTAVASNAGRFLDWLQAAGGLLVRNHAGLWIMAPPRPLTTALDWRGRGPDFMLRQLERRLRANGGELRRGTRGLRLVLADGACRGVEAVANGQPLSIAADAVVLADGGYQASTAMLERYVGPRPELVFPRHAGTSRGDGLAMAIEAGAVTVGLGTFYGHLLSSDAFSNDSLWPYPQIDAIASAGVLIDASGRRRFDEGKGGIYLANAMAWAGLGTAWVLCDDAIWNVAGKQHQIPPNPLLERHGGTVLRERTLNALARAAGLPEAATVATVERYNDAVRLTTLSALDPPRSESTARAYAIEQPPFLAIPVCSGITNSMGGIAVDGDGRVRAEKGGCIAGLYAAGAAIGGLDGGPDAGYVGGLVKAVFGLRAAEHAARCHEPAREAKA